MGSVNYFISEQAIIESQAFKDFSRLILTNGSVLSSRVENNILFEFAKVYDGRRTFILTTTDSRIWCLAINFSFPEGNETIYAFNKDIKEELQNG